MFNYPTMHAYSYPPIQSPISDDVLDVWQGNFKREIDKISELIEDYPIISFVYLNVINRIQNFLA